MKVTQLYSARHLLTATYSLAGVALLAIGANAALNVPTSEAIKVVTTQETVSAMQLALIIGNGNYPDAAERLDQPINDASGLAYAMRRHGFDVDMVEDATKADMTRAVERLKSRIKPGSVVMLFFGGYGVQSRHETYMTFLGSSASRNPSPMKLMASTVRKMAAPANSAQCGAISR